jgi:G:T/U-mismatch repair DNA glycosylase
MFKHFHPYEVFIPQNAKALIVGTLPPPRFCTKDFKQNDVDFCYGSEDGLLWKIFDAIYHLDLEYQPSVEAIKQRKTFLQEKKIGICDIVASCQRQKIDASDLGMQNIVLRDIIKYLKQNPTLDTLLFTGGNSKNGPEYLFRKQLKSYGLKLTCKEKNIPKKHEFIVQKRVIQTFSLTSPSNAANRFIGAQKEYKEEKANDKNYTTLDFRIRQYAKVFKACL